MTSPGSINAYGIEIRWQSTDLSTLLTTADINTTPATPKVTETSTGNSSGLNTGAKIGIGVGVTAAVFLYCVSFGSGNKNANSQNQLRYRIKMGEVGTLIVLGSPLDCRSLYTNHSPMERQSYRLNLYRQGMTYVR
jgi:hypothetical protein